MYKIVSTIAALASMTAASHLDNINGMFDTFSFDEVKFKTRTNCSLDKYPEVSARTKPRKADPYHSQILYSLIDTFD